MLYCKKCNNHVLLDNTSSISLVSDYTFTAKGIKPTVISITRLESKGDVRFICPTCGNVETKGIYGICQNCGAKHEVNELYKVAKHSGVYCADCCNNYFNGNGKVTLSKLIKVVTKTDKDMQEED